MEEQEERDEEMKGGARYTTHIASRSVSCHHTVRCYRHCSSINPIENHIPAGRCRATDLAATAGDRNEPFLFFFAAHSIAFFLSSARDEEKNVPNTLEKTRRTLPVESGIRHAGVTNEVKQWAVHFVFGTSHGERRTAGGLRSAGLAKVASWATAAATPDAGRTTGQLASPFGAKLRAITPHVRRSPKPKTSRRREQSSRCYRCRVKTEDLPLVC
ncbi:hypothetical protein MRX96_019462 [Rhipicephalus microplus]